jgi:hypothetical protein
VLFAIDRGTSDPHCAGATVWISISKTGIAVVPH